MLGKIWKKVLLFILIVACLFDVTIKLTKRNSLKNEIKATLNYFSGSDNEVKNDVKPKKVENEKSEKNEEVFASKINSESVNSLANEIISNSIEKDISSIKINLDE